MSGYAPDDDEDFVRLRGDLSRRKMVDVRRNYPSRKNFLSPDDGEDERFDAEALCYSRNHPPEHTDELPCDLAYSPEREPAVACERCKGNGLIPSRHAFLNDLCPACRGQGLFGIDPVVPTIAMPGSRTKVAVMAARFRARLPLYHAGDAGDSSAHDASLN